MPAPMMEDGGIIPPGFLEIKGSGTFPVLRRDDPVRLKGVNAV